MQNIYLKSIELYNFRNFQSIKIETENQPIILIGENGTGKTNILEAISLLSPGRGLRQTKFFEICRNNEHDWQVEYNLMSKCGISLISSYYDRASNKRSIEFNGSKLTNIELQKLVNIIWIIPQMKEIFIGSLTERRKFFDRIIYNFDSHHAAQINKYDYYLSERLKLLQNLPNNDLLNIIEEKIIQISFKIQQRRINIIEQLQIIINQLDHQFPKAKISIDFAKFDNLNNFFDYLAKNLFNSRKLDGLTGRTSFGIHRSDFIVEYETKNQLAKICSAGEQKAMIISINIAQILLYIKLFNTTPIVLLDEVFIHFDSRRKCEFINLLINQRIQYWITQTDLNGITSIQNHSKIIKLT